MTNSNYLFLAAEKEKEKEKEKDHKLGESTKAAVLVNY